MKSNYEIIKIRRVVRTESQKEICLSSHSEHNDAHIRHARS